MNDKSKDKKVNPPAFPVPSPNANEGMKLRDYFAAHAPALPDWFEPIMPNERPIPIPDTKRTYSGYNSNEAEINAWDSEQWKQAIIQWPYYYADTQLLQRQMTAGEGATK